MANFWQFNAPVAVPNLRGVRAVLVTEIDEDNKRMVVEVHVTGLGQIRQRESVWRLAITNGACDALAGHPTPSTIGDVIIPVSIMAPGTGIATAFDTAMTAFRAAGADKRGNLMEALAAITGTVQDPATRVGALAGTIVPILPAGSKQ